MKRARDGGRCRRGAVRPNTTVRIGAGGRKRAGVAAVLGALLVGVSVSAPVPAAEENCPDSGVRYERDPGSVSAMVPVPGEVTGVASRAGAGGGHELVVLLRPRGPLSEAGQRLEDVLARLREKGILDGDQAKKIDAPELGVVIAAGLKQEKARACLENSDVDRPRLAKLHIDQEGVSLELLPAVLPEDASALVTLDVDGDGDREIVIQTGQRLVAVSPEGELSATLLEDPDLDLRVEEARRVQFPPDPVAIRSPFEDDDNRVQMRGHATGPKRIASGWGDLPLHVRVTGLGELRIWAPHPAAPEWDTAAVVPLPVRATPDDFGLLLTAPQVRTVGVMPGGTLLLAAGPVPVGADRLRNVLIELDGRSAKVEDAWSRVDEGDEVDASGYLLLDGVPHLWTVTDNESSIDLFGSNEMFRLFRLSSDRTRLGGEALLSLEVGKIPLASGLKAAVDVNGDGRDDLVLTGRGDKTGIWTFAQKNEGRFSSSPARQILAADGRPLAFRDLDGDGRPDLVVHDGGSYRVHLGRDASGKDAVGDQAAWQAASLQPDGETPATFIRCSETWLEDLDDDGRHELACRGRDAYGRDGIKIVRFEPPPVPGS